MSKNAYQLDSRQVYRLQCCRVSYINYWGLHLIQRTKPKKVEFHWWQLLPRWIYLRNDNSQYLTCGKHFICVQSSFMLQLQNIFRKHNAKTIYMYQLHLHAKIANHFTFFNSSYSLQLYSEITMPNQFICYNLKINNYLAWDIHMPHYNLLIKNNLRREYAISNSPGNHFLIILPREFWWYIKGVTVVALLLSFQKYLLQVGRSRQHGS